jgi:hypothetical protein
VGCYPARGGGLFCFVGKGGGDEQSLRWSRETVEAEADRQFRARLQSIKDKLDLFGEEALSKEEMAIVAERRAFFYPEPWHPGQLA